MRRRYAAVCAAAAAAALCAVLASGASAAARPSAVAGAVSAISGGAWGKAEEVPGTAALNVRGNATVQSVSCAAARSCTAAGYYNDASGQHAFVVTEKGGRWGKAEAVPGLAALNPDGMEWIGSVSCASAGNCAVGGSYVHHQLGAYGQAFVVRQVRGRWGTAELVPGLAALGARGAFISEVSCGSPGNCAAGGQYGTGSGSYPFVVSEAHGRWGAAQEVPGTAGLNNGGDAQVSSVSCASAGNCAADGTYTDSSSHFQAFVVNETKGTWGAAQEVPGTAGLNKGGDAQAGSLSCASAGNCAADGTYVDSSGHQQPFVVSERNRAWGRAEELPGTMALNKAGIAQVSSLSCPSAGNCAAVGGYGPSQGPNRVLVASEAGGRWGRAMQLPGTPVADSIPYPSVSCSSAGYCVAAGAGFVTTETSGRWGLAEKVPGMAALSSRGGADLSSISCAPAGTCSAGGAYTKGTAVQAFVVSYTSRPVVTALSPARGRPHGGTVVTIRGRYFTGTTRVLFGKNPGTHLKVANAGELKVTAPAGTGTVTVTVTTPGGKSAATATTRYHYT